MSRFGRMTDYSNFENSVFGEAVKAIDAGDIDLLQKLLSEHPSLVNEQAHFPGAGYFENPYLIFFIADNPIRNEKLAENVLDILSLLILSVSKNAVNRRFQLEYTLGLVASGRIPAETGKQIAMMDLLIDAGAAPGEGAAALMHGNLDASKHLIKRGGKYTLLAAVCFDDKNKVTELIKIATSAELTTALAAAAFYGNAEMISLLLENNANPNGYPDHNFHTHATPLHQAVYSGNLASVKLLVAAGADLQAPDKAYKGTPLGWAQHMQTGSQAEKEKTAFKEIENYLSSL